MKFLEHLGLSFTILFLLTTPVSAQSVTDEAGSTALSINESTDLSTNSLTAAVVSLGDAGATQVEDNFLVRTTDESLPAKQDLENSTEESTRLNSSRADPDGDPLDSQDFEWDPWEPFNEKTFWFNHEFDRYLLKPIARAYNAVLPAPVRLGIGNAIDNLDVTRRFVNNLLQLDLAGGARELSRFVINSTVGLGGLIDVAKSTFGIAESNRDTGQTLGVYGVPHGPYLVLPFFPPFSVRDFFGYVADQAMDPLGYFMPFAPAIGFNVLDQVSERAANIDRFQGVEDSAVDLYGAVRNGYYQRRAADLKR